MSTPDILRHVAALARAVAILRKSPEPGATQKDAVRALVALAAERSATLRWYDSTLTLDGVAVPTTDPRLAAFTERLVAQHVAEITIAKDAGPDELLALTMGLAADAGQGRLKERLRDAGSARVMVILHQYDQRADRSVSAAFEKVKMDQGILSEWNQFLEQGARAEADRVAQAQPAGPEEGVRSPAAQAAPARSPTAALPPPPGVGMPAPTGAPPFVAPPPSAPTLQGGSTPDSWFSAFERGVKHRFADHFGDVDWMFRVDRSAVTVTAEDARGGSHVTVQLPRDFLQQSSWLLAGKVVEQLRQRAEAEGAIRKRR